VHRLERRLATPLPLLVATLVAFAVVLGCAIASGELLTLAERRDGSTAFDSSITSWMVAHRAHALTALARGLSVLGSQGVLLPAIGIVAAVLLTRRRFALTAVLVAAWGGAIGLYSLTKHFVQRPRPPMDVWLTKVVGTSSFPSGHATQSLATFLAMALVAAVWLPRARWPGRVLALVLAAGIGWSRIYLGVHWTTDVGAGWLSAAAWIMIVIWLGGVATSIEQRRRGGRQADTPDLHGRASLPNSEASGRVRDPHIEYDAREDQG
jgi:membrane-associated phospholipid phosphatase